MILVLFDNAIFQMLGKLGCCVFLAIPGVLIRIWSFSASFLALALFSSASSLSTLAHVLKQQALESNISRSLL